MAATSVLEELATRAILAGADTLEIEYKDGYEEVYALTGGSGVGITLPSSGQDAKSLRGELYSIAKRARRVTVDGCEYELRARIWNSFGEDAFRVPLRRAKTRGSG
ncbi:MAG: hypothetical protein ACLP59_28440 [Bryobacteraceae bacterium]